MHKNRQLSPQFTFSRRDSSNIVVTHAALLPLRLYCMCMKVSMIFAVTLKTQPNFYCLVCDLKLSGLATTSS